jgi:hypothetical protein
MRRRLRVALTTLAGAGVLAGGALAAPHGMAAHGAAPARDAPRTPATFSGSCQFGGPLSIGRPITVVPVPGAHFSYAGTGTCTGTLDGSAVSAAPLTVTFPQESTLFDTCELGPDIGLTGVARIAAGRRVDRFDVRVDLARLALAGPFVLRTAHHGWAAGVAQFQPPGAPQDALAACAGAGVATATLSASFSSIAPLVGTRGRARHP